MTKTGKIFIATFGVILGVFIIVGAILVGVKSESTTSNAIAIVKEDSGIAACKQIVENAKNPSSNTPSSKMTDAQRLEKRKPWEGSKHADLRTAGTQLVEALYKADNELAKETPDDATLEDLGEDLGTAVGVTALINTKYALLQNACGAHGVTLPSL